MAVGCNFVSGVAVAAGAGVGGVTCGGAGGVGHNCVVGVAGGGDGLLRGEDGVTLGAVRACGLTGLGAGGSHSGIQNLVVAGGCDCLGVGVAAGAGEGLHALSGTGGLSGHDTVIAVGDHGNRFLCNGDCTAERTDLTLGQAFLGAGGSHCGDGVAVVVGAQLPLAVLIDVVASAGLDSGTISVGQLGCADRNSVPCVILVALIRVALEDLIELGIFHGVLSNDRTGTGAADVAAGCGGIDVALGNIQEAIDLDSCIHQACSGTGRGGASGRGVCGCSKLSVIRIDKASARRHNKAAVKGNCFLGDPVALAVDINRLVLGNRDFCAFLNDDIGAGQHGQAILNLQLGTGLDPHGNMVGQGEVIVLGLQRNAANKAGLNGNLHLGECALTVDFEDHAVGAFLIVLGDGTGFQVKNTIGTNKLEGFGNNADQSDAHGKMDILLCACFQSHGHFNVLHIVLAHGEDSVLIVIHGAGDVAAVPLLGLEMLIGSCAALDQDGTGTADETPCIEVRAGFHRDGTAAVHV